MVVAVEDNLAQQMGYKPELSPRGLHELQVGTFRQEILTGGEIVNDWADWFPVSVDDATERLLKVQMLCKHGDNTEQTYDGLRIDKQSWRSDALIRCMDLGGSRIIEKVIESSQHLPGGEDCFKADFLYPAIEEAFLRAADNCQEDKYTNLAKLKEQLLRYSGYVFHDSRMDIAKEAISNLPEDSKLKMAYDKLNGKLAA